MVCCLTCCYSCCSPSLRPKTWGCSPKEIRKSTLELLRGLADWKGWEKEGAGVLSDKVASVAALSWNGAYCW